MTQLREPAREPVRIEVVSNRGQCEATASYTVGRKERSCCESANQRVNALHRIVSRMRRNGHGGKSYVATIDGETLHGIIPRPRKT